MNSLLRFRIVSDSMHPLLRVGDEIVWEKINNPFLDLKRFDLLLFKQDQILYCHFVWQIRPKSNVIITRAYRYLWHEDLPIAPECILGKVKNCQLNFWQKLRVYLYFLLRRRS